MFHVEVVKFDLRISQNQRGYTRFDPGRCLVMSSGNARITIAQKIRSDLLNWTLSYESWNKIDYKTCVGSSVGHAVL